MNLAFQELTLCEIPYIWRCSFNKAQITKNEENSEQFFRDRTKPWGVRALGVSTGYQFLKQIRLWRFYSLLQSIVWAFCVIAVVNIKNMYLTKHCSLQNKMFYLGLLSLVFLEFLYNYYKRKLSLLWRKCSFQLDSTKSEF